MPYISYEIKCGVCDGVSTIRIGGLQVATKPENSPLAIRTFWSGDSRLEFTCSKCPTPRPMILPTDEKTG